MRPFHSLSATLARLFMVSACISLYATGIGAAGDPAAPYLGMSEAEIIACAGEPHARFKSGAEKVTLTYHYSGAGPVPGAPGKSGEEKKDKLNFFGGDKKKKGKDWTCSASVVFENGRLIRVTFSHKDVHSPYDWQKERDPAKQEAMRKAGVPTCTFSLPNCLR